MAITKPDQVWTSDITYIPLQHGFLYLAAVMDLYSRYVLSWRLSKTLTGDFCLEALDAALVKARPEIFNTDQGAQFTILPWNPLSRSSAHDAVMSRVLQHLASAGLAPSISREEVFFSRAADRVRDEDAAAERVGQLKRVSLFS
jgi:putative transposase